jgi:hypothetical protein
VFTTRLVPQLSAHVDLSGGLAEGQYAHGCRFSQDRWAECALIGGSVVALLRNRARSDARPESRLSGWDTADSGSPSRVPS